MRSWIRRLERDARGHLESFELLDGSTYYYDGLETYKELFLHAYDVQLGEADKWLEPPEVYRKICEARDPEAVLERFKPEDPKRAFVNLAELYDTDALVRERRLVPLTHEPVEDLSNLETRKHGRGFQSQSPFLLPPPPACSPNRPETSPCF